MVALKDYEELINAALESKVDAIISGAGLPLRLPELVKDHDVLIAPIVSSGKACKVIIKHWLKKYQRTPDFIVIEGSQAGGHLGFKKEDLENQTCQSLEEIFKDVEEIVENNKLNIPIFVAGGISQRSDVKHFFDLGVDGIQVATRFITTYECDASIKYKEAFLKAIKEDIGFVSSSVCRCLFFFFNDTATTEIYTLSLHDALPIYFYSPRWICRMGNFRELGE